MRRALIPCLILVLLALHGPASAAKLIVSVSGVGNGGNANSGQASVSSDGDVIAFFSDSDDLVPSDANGVRDVFVRTISIAETERVSVAAPGGTEGPSEDPAISDDGTVVAFETTGALDPADLNTVSDIYVRDLAQNQTVRISTNGPSTNPSVSADGRFVAFESVGDVLVYDRLTDATTRVSDDRKGDEPDGESFNPSISDDGRFVAFQSAASDLVKGDDNAKVDIFRRDLKRNKTVLVSVGRGADADGDSINPSISGHGKVVAFESVATNLTKDDANGATSDVFMRTVKKKGKATRIAQGTLPAISGDGSKVAFESIADLIGTDDGSDSDVFLGDDGSIGRVSLTDTGDEPDKPSFGAAIAGDGSRVAFESAAENITPTPTEGRRNVYVVDV